MIRIFLFVFVFIIATALNGQVVQVNTSGAKLRAHGGLQYEVLATLNQGERLEVIGIMRQLDDLGDYGVNCWLKVQIDTTTGYLYGALATLMPPTSNLIPVKREGFIHSSSKNANIRSSPNRGAYCLFQLYEGDPIYVLGKTNKETIPGLGTHPWYLIESNNRKGFVFGALITSPSTSLVIQEGQADLYDGPNGNPVGRVFGGEQYKILDRSSTTKVIWPLGRNYWYLIEIPDRGAYWIFGGATSMEFESVDCQCVDYIKHYLRISGPTAHAAAWPDLLLGEGPVTQRGKEQYLSYTQVSFNQVKNKDIAVFGTDHPQADSQYGHIGIVREIRQNGQGGWEILIEGGNHKAPISKGFYREYRCNNISQKWYQVTSDIYFFRKEKS